MPNVMAALPNVGGAHCSMPQSGWHPLGDRKMQSSVVTVSETDTET